MDSDVVGKFVDAENITDDERMVAAKERLLSSVSAAGNFIEAEL